LLDPQVRTSYKTFLIVSTVPWTLNTVAANFFDCFDAEQWLGMVAKCQIDKSPGQNASLAAPEAQMQCDAPNDALRIRARSEHQGDSFTARAWAGCFCITNREFPKHITPLIFWKQHIGRLAQLSPAEYSGLFIPTTPSYKFRPLGHTRYACSHHTDPTLSVAAKVTEILLLTCSKQIFIKAY